MTISRSATRGVPVTLQDALTTGNGREIAIPDSFKNHTITITGSAGVASGAIQIEASDEAGYAGTWAQVGGGPVTVIASAKQVLNFTGVYRFLRTRISTTIGSGTVTVSYEGS